MSLMVSNLFTTSNPWRDNDQWLKKTSNGVTPMQPGCVTKSGCITPTVSTHRSWKRSKKPNDPSISSQEFGILNFEVCNPSIFSNPVLPWKHVISLKDEEIAKVIEGSCSNMSYHHFGAGSRVSAPSLLTIMSCRMITTVIKCQQPSILPLALFFSYLDVWGAATSRWGGGQLLVQTICGTGPDPIFFLSLQAMENSRSLRVHEVTTSQIPVAWQWTTMPDMLGEISQCHATVLHPVICTICFIYIYYHYHYYCYHYHSYHDYYCIIVILTIIIRTHIVSYIVLLTAPLAKHHQATQETKAQIQTRITSTAMHQDPSARAHPKEAHLSQLWNW